MGNKEQKRPVKDLGLGQKGRGTKVRGAKRPALTPQEAGQKQGREMTSLPVWVPGDVILGTYEVEDVISGGMGNVYISNHTKWNRKVAIKSPNETILSDPVNFPRILREANSWTEMGLHPNIAYCYYVRNIEDIPHIVVEYVDGGNLRQWIEDGRCIDYRANLDLAIQFCHGMEYAHSKGMIHRDIKPENVLMTKDGILKITDFGLVRGQGSGVRGQGEGVRSDGRDSTPEQEGLTTIGTFMGTEGYVSPEQAEDPHTVDERTDIFSFGVCLCEMFCGGRPYQVTYGEKQAPPDPVSMSRDEKFPSDLAEVIKKCICWDARDRFSGFRDMRIALASVYEGLFGGKSPYEELGLVGLAADGLNNQGISYLELGRKEDAVRCWHEALKKDPTHPETTYNLSLFQWRSAEIDDTEVLRRLDNCRNNPSISLPLLEELTASVHAERFDPDAAEHALRRAPETYECLFSGTDTDQIKDVRTFTGHRKCVSATAITRDGTLALSGSWDKDLRVWDLATGCCVQTLMGHTSFVNAVAVAGVKGLALSGSHDRTVRLWDLDAGTCIRIMEGHRDVVSSVALSAEGELAFSGSADKTIRVWDAATGRCLRTLTGHRGWVKSIALTGDGKRLLSAGADKTIRVWDAATGRCLLIMEGHQASVNAVAVTTDGNYALSGSTDKTLKLWETETGHCLRTMEGHANTVFAVAVAGNGKLALSTSWGSKTIRVWETATGRCRRTLKGHTGSVLSVAVTGDGSRAISASWDKTLMLWDISCNHPFIAAPCFSQLRGFEDRKRDHDRLNHLIRRVNDLQQKENYGSAATMLFEKWEAMGFRDEEAILNCYSRLMKVGRKKGLVLHSQEAIFHGHTAAVTSVAMTGDGRWALSASPDRTVRVWDVHTGRCVRTFKGHAKGVNSVAVTGDGSRALSGSWDTTLRLWDGDSGTCIRVLKGHEESVNSVVMTEDGMLALSGSNDQSVKLWELATGSCIRTMSGHTYYVRSVSITADGSLGLSASADKTLRVWHIHTGRCLRILEGHTDTVTCGELTVDGARAISGSEDKTLRVWDVHTGRCVRTLKGHTAGVNAVAMTGDGQWALSAGSDKTMRVWDVESGRCVKVIEGHSAGLTSAALTEDGRWAISGSADKALSAWRFIWELQFGG
jgi:WD40 repeat protein